MKKLLILFSIISVGSTALAQKIKVRKVKGSQAVIEFSGGSLQTGQVYELAPDEFGESSVSATSRNYLVSLTMSLDNSKSDASGASNETDFSATGRLGLNYGGFEVGPVVSFSSNQSSSTTTTAYLFGAFGDYNVIPNSPGEAFIYGLGAVGAFGQIDSGSGSKSDLLSLNMGPFVKWFPTGSNVGFRIDAGYVYQKLSGGSSGDVTVTGLSVAAGIASYF